MQATVCFYLGGCSVHMEPFVPGWKHNPTICCGLIQTTLGQRGAPEQLQYIDDIVVWGDTAEEVFKKGGQIIGILLCASFAIKGNKVKGPAQEIQFLGLNGKMGIVTSQEV